MNKKKNLTQLESSIYFLKVGELKKIIQILNLNFSGNKPNMIRRIIAWYENKEENFKTEKPVTQIISPIANPKTHLMKGIYKNNAESRTIFQSLIGPHFHFTVFGLDWLNQQWNLGISPTFQEFAKFWQEEFEKRKIKKAPLKDEWMFLRFQKEFKEKHPNATNREFQSAWHKIRQENLNITLKLLEIKFL